MSEFGSRYAYAPFEPAMADDCMEIYARWLATKGAFKVLQSERDSVQRALYHTNELGVDGGVILIDGKPEAFSIGERFTDDMAVIHIEKANIEIPELFSVVNREFTSHAFSDLLWINREEDMGDEGLRGAKQSYHPARMIQKFCMRLREDE
jgi:hypothetical protein